MGSSNDWNEARLARNERVWNRVLEVGSQSAVARELGVQQGHVRGYLISHGARIGWTGHLPGSSPASMPLPEILRMRNSHVNDRRRILLNRTLADAIEHLSTRVEQLEARVVELESRPAVSEVRVVEWRPNHRRIADGGRPVRDQRREVGIA